jgi:hypothetical protein
MAPVSAQKAAAPVGSREVLWGSIMEIGMALLEMGRNAAAFLSRRAKIVTNLRGRS